ncbi:MAG: type II toxin-antitoxin system Phd/YefM family antitoxin [Coriobacteriales bacterium]|jgi:PHD/YefM family antitoxin component YafN of YafNO toxin-antitoxin module|nr:type II toxin-antitoxin system Phd/YefM family antitoxin [Coriobacteriales bacterium]
MPTVSATRFRQDIFSLLSETIRDSNPLLVTTKEGNAIVISESDYNALQETLYLSSIPGMRDKVLDGMETPLDECIIDNEW